MRRSLHFSLAAAALCCSCATRREAKFDGVPGASPSAASLPPGFVSGSASRPDPAAPPAAHPAGSKSNHSGAATLIITPNPVLTGHVVSYHPAGRFVVLNFPIGRLPTLEQTLDLYRLGIKVGTVKVTGPQRDDHIVADVTEGEAQAGDEVRER